MVSMDELIKQLHAANARGETQAPKKAESANKRKSQATTSSEPGQLSDADDLLADASNRKLQTMKVTTRRAAMALMKKTLYSTKLHSPYPKRRKLTPKFRINLQKS